MIKEPAEEGGQGFLDGSLPTLLWVEQPKCSYGLLHGIEWHRLWRTEVRHSRNFLLNFIYDISRAILACKGSYTIIHNILLRVIIGRWILLLITSKGVHDRRLHLLACLSGSLA